MLDLLAMDTMQVAQHTEPERVAPPKSILALATGAGAAGAVLIWLIAAGPGFLGYGASLLWAGAPKSGAQLLRHHGAARQQADPPQSRSAGHRAADRVRSSEHVRLMAKYQSAAKWEEARMVPRDGHRIRISVRRRAGAGGILRRSVRREVEDLQAGRRGSARHQAHQGHLSFPDMARDRRTAWKIPAAICARCRAPRPS